jgi:hypothetical protein
MQFDFALSANASQRIEVSGSFMKYKTGAGPIRVTMSNGGVLDLLPGQGVRGVAFSGLSVKDMSGGANAGVLLAGNFEFTDDTINGAVALADPYLAVLQSQRDYIASVVCPPGGGNACGTLVNIAGSGRNVVVERVSVCSIDFTALFAMLSVGTFVPSGLQTSSIQNKKLGGAAPVGARISAAQQSNPTPTPPNVMCREVSSTGTGGTIEVVFRRPLVLPPGYTLAVSNWNIAGNGISVNFEFSEVLQ